MKLKGFQKVTLLDYPGKVACTVFTGGCNMRCPFCHNASLVTRQTNEKLSEEEFWEYLKRCQGKLDAVCVSGGEPLLQKDLKEFLLKIKELGYLVKLDTNGVKTKELQDLCSLGLVDYVAMDVKNTLLKYAMTCGINVDTKAIRESVEFLKSSGIRHEFRTTVVKNFHTLDDIIELIDWVSPSFYYLQQFEDSGDLIGENLQAYTKEEFRFLVEEGKKKSNFVQGRGV